MSEYTHNDDVADILYAKDQEIAELKRQLRVQVLRIDKYRNSINALSLSIDEDYANGF
tara:strand:- start:283 stop:456 length:174 start_codon:yes stop_codon:yes gene_type:complete